MVEKADVIGVTLIVAIVIGLPMAVAQLNEWKIGPADEPVVIADNILTGTYQYDNSTGGTETAPLSYSYLSGENEEYLSVTVPTVSDNDIGPSVLTIEFNKPEAQTMINQGIIELYSQVKTTENYENMDMQVTYAGSTGSMTVYDNSNVEATQNFAHIEEIGTDYAYSIKDAAGDNATPKVVLTNPAGDNKLLSGEVLEARSWGFDAETSVALTHKGVWQLSLTLMGVFSMFAAVLATNKLDLEFN